MQNKIELGHISNTCYSRANRTSYYTKQTELFKKNIHQYDLGISKQEHVHKHVREISDMFMNLAMPVCSKPHSSHRCQKDNRANTCAHRITQRKTVSIDKTNIHKKRVSNHQLRF